MKINKKALGWLFLILITFNIIANPVSSVKAAINSNYGDNTTTVNEYSTSAGSSQVLEWISQIVYTLASGIEVITSKIMSIFTGNDAFPWADKIIFNTIPILDVNFINPANGSFFKDVKGNITPLGNTIRNTYFTILSISLGFLGLLVGLLAVKMAVTTIASKKAVYKEAVTGLLTCIALLFGLHYLLSGMFYVNEKMVEIASNMLTKTLENSQEVIDKLVGLSDENNEKVVKNFTKQAGKECFLASIPIIGGMYKGLLNCIHAIGRFLSDIKDAIVGFFTGEKNEQKEISKEQLGEIYPSKDTYIQKIEENETSINVCAYLLKNKYYRKSYLQWVKGNDTNSLQEGGLGGVARNILISVNDVFGVADNGYKALRTLYTSMALITYDPVNKPTPSGRPFESVQREGLKKQNADKESGEILGEDGKPMTDEDGQPMRYEKMDLQEANDYYSQKIHSDKDYKAYIEAIDAEVERIENMTEQQKKDNSLSDKDIDGIVRALSLNRVYAEAYYKYVLDPSKKTKPGPGETISEMGQFFKNTAWYIDVNKGGWSPTSISVLNTILYGIFIFQSIIFLFAYMKRFFYVVLLSLIGPVVVVYDFGMTIMKSI